MPPDDDLDALLGALPVRSLDPRVSAQSLRAARAVLATPESGLYAMARAFWERALAPALVVGTVASYLVWAMHSAGALYQ